MAGGKETPRQKLVGMMYLVLTAMLALQVSSKILEKFIFIEDALNRTASNTTTKNETAVLSIEKAVEQLGNSSKELPKVELAKQVREKTSEVIAYIEETRMELINQSNAIDESSQTYRTGALKNTSVTGELFIVKKKGEEMKARLNSYGEEVSALLKQKAGIDLAFQPVALDAKDIPVFAKSTEPDVRNASYEKITFEKAPVGGVLAVFAQYKNDILNIESEALAAISSTVGSIYIKSDVINAMVNAESRVVAEGTKFTGQMFIAASSSSITPRMTVNGSSIPVENGFGKVEFTATGGNYGPDGLAKKSFEGQITINNAGKDTTFTVKYDYLVAKPVIEVEAAVVKQLYANCANELTIKVPALGVNYNPDFRISGGTALKGGQPGQVIIVPTANPGSSLGIEVFNGGSKIGQTLQYQVRDVPAPKVQIKIGGNPVDLTNPVQFPNAVDLSLLVDESFASTMAKDNNFAITDGNIYVNNLAGQRQSLGKITGSNINLARFRGNIRPGETLVFEILSIERTNFQGKKIKVKIAGEREVIQLRIKQ